MPTKKVEAEAQAEEQVQEPDPVADLKQAIKDTDAKLEDAKGDNKIALEQQRTSLQNQLEGLKARQKAERKAQAKKNADKE